MAFYAVDNKQAAAVAEKTLCVLKTAATKRAKIIELFMGGADATPVDNNIEVIGRRATVSFTTPVAGTAPQALDPAEPAATVTRDDSGAAEPTYTANSELLRAAMNGRATIRWVPPVPGLALVVPISGFFGLPITIGAVVNVGWHVYYEE